MHLFFSPARAKERLFGESTVWSESGLALLARTPWRSGRSIDLPSDPRDGERIAQVATVDFGGTSITFANLHLTHLRDADMLRREQIGAILATLLSAGEAGPVVLLGDFNTPPGGPVLRPLLAGGSGFDVRDAWLLGGGASQRGTIPARMDTDVCVDYVLSIAPPGRQHPHFRGSAVALTAPGPGGTLPSDHFAVTTCIELNSPTTEEQ